MKPEEKKLNNRKNRFSGVIVEGNYLSAEEVIKSWEGGFVDKVASGEGELGLRPAQFGALCAIRSHWTVSKQPSTISMPTGTGKTETMLATIIAEKIKRTLIIVPTSMLRIQIYNKIRHWGILYETGNLNDSVLTPNTLLIEAGISDFHEFQEIVLNSNVIISTLSLLERQSVECKKYLSEACDLLIVDEAHHIVAKTWTRFKQGFNTALILQFTATPFRADGKKIDGEIIYNFPLNLAQKQGYFKEIIFEPVEEFNENKKDFVIAERAVELLKKDLDEGFNHLLLVRAATIAKAKFLYNDIYAKYYPSYNPVLIVSNMAIKDKRENLRLLNAGKTRIVVCVDMFGEGIDIPNLKIAAIHDKYKSMPITLQFIGRFARASKDLGSAKIVANIADENIVEAIKDLYAKDTDWNKLLPLKSNEYIENEVNLQKMARDFTGDAKENFSFTQMRPKVSMIAYKTNQKEWHWENWVKKFNTDDCHYMVNEKEKILIIIEPREIPVSWTTQRNFSEMLWVFYVIYWNEEKNVVFVNSSDKSKGFSLVKAIFADDIETIMADQIFKCLYGIKRLALATVGLNSGIDGPVRYKMFAGIDVAQGITESNKNNCYKSNLFGIGYDGTGKVSIGCSYKGTVWSRWIESVDFWKNWCNEIIDKILDPSIDVATIMEGVLIPKVIKKLPSQQAYRIDWPNNLEFETSKKIQLSNISGDYTIEDVDILLEEDQVSGQPLQFKIFNEDFWEKFSFDITETTFNIKSLGNVSTQITIGNTLSGYLSKYFQENPPTIWYVDGSSIQGNIKIELSNIPGGEFPVSNISTRNWIDRGINIKVESQLEKSTNKKKLDSIQYSVIQEMKTVGDYSIIFDDDGTGEIADVIGIIEEEKSIRIDLFHCKYAHGDNPGARLSDLYEVCGQAEKSVFWKQKRIEMIDRMKTREIQRINNDKPSRFEIGNLHKLSEIRNKLLMQRSDMKIYIVQPGVNSETITPGMHRVLLSCQSYCMDTYSIPVYLVCS